MYQYLVKENVNTNTMIWKNTFFLSSEIMKNTDTRREP